MISLLLFVLLYIWAGFCVFLEVNKQENFDAGWTRFFMAIIAIIIWPFLPLIYFFIEQ